MWSLRTAGAGSSPAPSGHASERPEEVEQRAVLCAACKSTLCDERAATERFGSHHHDRVNPAGFTFTLQLFEHAPGTRAVGDESGEFAWFPHHRWCVLACAICGQHVGWRFRRDAAAFVGLIAAAIERSRS